MGDKAISGAQMHRPQPAFGSRLGLTGMRSIAVFNASTARPVRRGTARARVRTRPTAKKRSPTRVASPRRGVKSAADIKANRMKNLRKAQRALKAKRAAAKGGGG